MKSNTKISILVICILTLLFYSCENKNTKITPSNDVQTVQPHSTDNIKNWREIIDKATTEINIPNYTSNDMYLVNDNLFICASDGSTEFAKYIINYNIKTKKSNMVFTSEFKDPSVQSVTANERWLTWVDSDGWGFNSRIYVQDIESGKREIAFKIDSNDPLIISPYLCGDYVAWIMPQEHKDDLTTGVVNLYDIKKKKTKTIGKISHLNFYNAFIFGNNKKILWTDSSDNKGVYKLYNIENNELTQYDSQFVFPGYAQFINNNIYSINFQDYKDWTSQQFGMFDLTEKVYKKINSNLYINSFRVSGDFVSTIDGHGTLNFYNNDKLLNKVTFEKSRIEFIYPANNNRILALKSSEKNEKVVRLYLIDFNIIKSE